MFHWGIKWLFDYNLHIGLRLSLCIMCSCAQFFRPEIYFVYYSIKRSNEYICVETKVFLFSFTTTKKSINHFKSLLELILKWRRIILLILLIFNSSLFCLFSSKWAQFYWLLLVKQSFMFWWGKRFMYKVIEWSQGIKVEISIFEISFVIYFLI